MTRTGPITVSAPVSDDEAIGEQLTEQEMYWMQFVPEGISIVKVLKPMEEAFAGRKRGRAINAYDVGNRLMAEFDGGHCLRFRNHISLMVGMKAARSVRVEAAVFLVKRTIIEHPSKS